MIDNIRANLNEYSDPLKIDTYRRFFKNCKNDVFLGVKSAFVKKVSKEFWETTLDNVLELMKSKVHEERSVAHGILRIKFKKGDEKIKTDIFNFYINNRNNIKDWDGVDDSAPYIVGPYLLKKDKTLLYDLAVSKHIWDRRIAIVSTWWFIRNNYLDDTFYISKILINDKEDLIQKAVGWMLREAGKRNIDILKKFLDVHYKIMPRTMLRYSIEKFSEQDRKYYLNK